ncbi:MAG TPA: hypothetical protein VH207_11710 [Chthoniobacterales bacterium]|jgi:hypothetical protein|nr:hypothetical protein [Chthoniobacterales bacterium]
MNFSRTILCALALAPAAAIWAESSPGPDNTSAQAAKAETAAAEAAPSPSATVPDVEPPSLIPPNILPAPASLPQIPAAPDLGQLNDVFKQTSLGKAADEHRLHLQMSQLETRIRNDDDLHGLKTAAKEAPTDLERRRRLRTYYKLYYRKLRALASTPDLKAYLATQEAAHELSLLQPRVRHETDEAEAAELAKARAGASVAPAPTPYQARAGEALRP